jgi:Ricin-type beta-trefoil lectin domain
MDNHCVTITDADIGLYPCVGNITLPSWGQRFELSYFKDIAQYNIQQFDCLEPEANTRYSRLVKAECIQKQGAQLWKYDPVSVTLFSTFYFLYI